MMESESHMRKSRANLLKRKPPKNDRRGRPIERRMKIDAPPEGVRYTDLATIAYQPL